MILNDVEKGRKCSCKRIKSLTESGLKSKNKKFDNLIINARKFVAKQKSFSETKKKLIKILIKVT